MKKIILSLVLILSILLFCGCRAESVDSVEEQERDAVSVDSLDEQEEVDTKEEQEESTVNEEVESPDNKTEDKGEPEPVDAVDYTDYVGDYKLNVDSDLYLITDLDIYLGITNITIEQIKDNFMKGTFTSIQGPPSYRQAIVEFEGEIVDGILVTPYQDESWEYSGDITLVFDNGTITAKISRNKQESPSMWGIPEGEFEFVRPIVTEKILLTTDDITNLETLLYPLSRDRIKPFFEGELTDDMIINFVGINIALGTINSSQFGDRINENGAMITFDETIMNDISKQYFGTEVGKHKSFDIITYMDETYEVPALGGVAEYPVIQLMLKDKNKDDIYYAVVDYIFDYPEGGETLEYQYLIKLRKDKDNYIIKYIMNIDYPIDFTIFNQL